MKPVLITRFQEPEINEKKEIGVLKVLELVPRFPKLKIKPDSFWGSFPWFWKIRTPVYEMEIKGKRIKAEGNNSNPGFISYGWIHCLYDIAPEMMRGKGIWEKIYDGLDRDGKCFVISSYIPTKTEYWTGKGLEHGFITIAAKEIVIDSSEPIHYSDKLMDIEILIIKKILKKWIK